MIVRRVQIWLSRVVWAGTALGMVTLPAFSSAVSALPDPAGGRSWLAYVPNFASNDVSVINTQTRQVTGTIPVGDHPIAVAFTPDARKAYIVNSGSHDVSVISTSDNQVIATIKVGENPQRIAVTPDGRKAYVVNGCSNYVSVINTETNTTREIPIGAGQRTDTILPNGREVWVNLLSEVKVIDTATDRVRLTFPVEKATVLSGTQVAPNGTTAYITNYLPDVLFLIDPATHQIVSKITEGISPAPFGIAIDPDGALAYVIHHALSLPILDLKTGTAVGTVGLDGYAARQVSFTPDGTFAYVGLLNDLRGVYSHQVLVIDAADHRIDATIDVGTRPSATAITPDQAPVARLTVTRAPSGSPAQLDASASTVEFGTIVKFTWRFGDGTTATTSGPVTHHVYAVPGRYRVTVTETSSGGTSTKRVFTGQTMARNGGRSATAVALVRIKSPQA